MTNNDWQEAYFDLVNKVECECVQQGDLVPIWDQFKAMSAELAKFKALAETLAGALERIALSFTIELDDEDGPVNVWLDAEELSDLAREALHQYKEARDA